MSDDIFDPEIHASDKDGNPSLNKDGSFRKKRRDAGKRGTSTGTRTRTRSGTGTRTGGAAGDQRARYVKAVGDTLMIPTAILTVVDPVDGFCAQQLAPVWAEAIADLAVEQPQVAAVVERLASAGAMGSILGVGLLTVAQFAHNHGKVPETLARMVGARPRGEVERLLQQRGEQLAGQAGPEAAREHPGPVDRDAGLANAA